MRWEKPAETMMEIFENALPQDLRVERRKMFGCPVGFVNGNMFAGLHENKIILRLSDEEREHLSSEYQAQPFEPFAGRLMKGWIVIPACIRDDQRLLQKWTLQAFLMLYLFRQKSKN